MASDPRGMKTPRRAGWPDRPGHWKRRRLRDLGHGRLPGPPTEFDNSFRRYRVADLLQEGIADACLRDRQPAQDLLAVAVAQARANVPGLPPGGGRGGATPASRRLRLYLASSPSGRGAGGVPGRAAPGRMVA